MKKKILIVDDETNIVDILELNLQTAGYTTIRAHDGEAGLRLALSENPDLILLDVMLPYQDGFSVCQTFRAHNKTTPVIMLTARDEERDMIYGLDLGADDYITKPFSLQALLARVKTNVRRGAATEETPESEHLVLGRLSIDTTGDVVYKDGTLIDLTQREYHLLRCLSATLGRVISREALMQEVWQYDYYGDLRAVDVAVRRLREKIEDNASNPQYILTKRGMGYYFEVPQ